MPAQDDATALPTPANITPLPSSPAEAFAQSVELIRKSPVTLVGVPADDIFHLLPPFIVNPARNQAAVREIAEAFGAVKMATSLAPMLKMIRWIPGNKKLKGTMEQFNPNGTAPSTSDDAQNKSSARPRRGLSKACPISGNTSRLY
jgi:hypothetical protein